MENKEAQKRIIDLLIKNEEIMRDLYRAYAKKFSIFEEFWNKIAEDEESHAAWINTLYNKMQTGLVDFSEQRFPADAIQKTIEYIALEKVKINQGEMSLVHALETAVHIERGMLENKFFEIFKDDSLELKIILEALELGTEQHLQEIKKMWEKEKGGSAYEKVSA